MKYAKIQLPKNNLGAKAFMELAKTNRVVGVNENGTIVYQVPADSLELLDKKSLPYEILASGLPSPARPMESD